MADVQALRALIFHPPPQIFAGPEDPDIFEFNISITAYALGQRFNEPLPFNPGTPGARPEGFPSDMIQFPVVVRRVNRRPFFFVDVPHFSVSQMQDLCPWVQESLLCEEELTLQLPCASERPCQFLFPGWFVSALH